MQQATTEPDWVFDVTASEFESRVVQADAPVIVDFWAEWCAPCRQIAPILDALAKHYGGGLYVAKVNVDQEAALAQAFGVRSIPYLVVFSGGQAVEQLVGVQPEAELKRVVERYVQASPGGQDTATEAAFLAGDYEQALPLLEQAHAATPEDPRIAADLGRCLLALGRADEAERILDGLSADAASTPAVGQLRAEIALSREAAGLRDRDTLEALLSAEPDNLSVRHELARVTAAAGDLEAALEHYFAIMSADRAFADDAGRLGLLGLFEVMDADDGRVRAYRRSMANLLN